MSINEITKEEVFNKFGGRCAYCGVVIKPIDRSITGQKIKIWAIENNIKDIKGMFEIDHIIPKSRGGSDDISNLFPSCSECNQIKNDRNLDYLKKRLRMKMFFFEFYYRNTSIPL